MRLVLLGVPSVSFFAASRSPGAVPTSADTSGGEVFDNPRIQRPFDVDDRPALKKIRTSIPIGLRP
jgi:hypothetical protein